MKKLILLLSIVLFTASCSKKEQTEFVQYQQVNVDISNKVSPDFEIPIPDCYSSVISSITLEGLSNPAISVKLLFKLHSSYEYDTLPLPYNFKIDLNPSYFDNNTLKGKIISNQPVTILGKLTILYNSRKL